MDKITMINQVFEAQRQALEVITDILMDAESRPGDKLRAAALLLAFGERYYDRLLSTRQKAPGTLEGAFLEELTGSPNPLRGLELSEVDSLLASYWGGG